MPKIDFQIFCWTPHPTDNAPQKLQNLFMRNINLLIFISLMWLHYVEEQSKSYIIGDDTTQIMF